MTIILDQSTVLPKASAQPRALACLNALTHGGTSQRMFIPGEDPTLFDTLMDEAFELYKPSTTADAGLVTDSVHARWVLWRRQRAHTNLEYDLHEKHPETLDWTAEDYHSLELLDRYKTQAERALRRALVNVKDIRKEQLDTEKWRGLLALNKDKFALERDKFELVKAKDARLAPKIEAEVQRDIGIAKFETPKIREEYVSKPEEPVIQFNEELNAHVIKQSISVLCHDDGSAYIDDIRPDHDEVRNLIQNSHQYKQPLDHVLRKFRFETFIPNEYTFLMREGHKLPMEGRLICEQLFNIENFNELAETERQILASQEAT